MSKAPSGIREFAPQRIVPVVVIHEVAHAEPLREALKSGGIHCAEVTFRTQAAAESIRVMAEDPDFMVGAGTVINADLVEAARKAGSRFVVSPGISKEVVRACLDSNLPVFPGVITPSEVMTALDLGLTELKFFPAGTAGGSPALKALAGPFAQVSFVPTGGISAANAAEYLALSNVAAVGGSWFTPADHMKSGNFQEITRMTAEAVQSAMSQEK